MIDGGEVRALLCDAVVRGVAPRLDAAIWHGGELWEESTREGPAGIFDLASLTKPLASGLVALSLAAEGRLDLDAPEIDGASPRQLLDHSAGYAAWAPLFKACLADIDARRVFSGGDARPFDRSRSLIEEAVALTRPSWPAGSRFEYSDLGFLKLGFWLERKGGAPLVELFQRKVCDPLGVSLAFVDLSREARLSAEPTGTQRPRPPAPGQEIALAGVAFAEVGPRPGEVDDDHAYALGGAAGHAGLFGTAREVARLGAAFLGECGGAGKLAPTALARAFCEPSGPGDRGLGWDRASPAGSSLGVRLGSGPRGAVGHLGFTGTSLWIDLDREIVVALCSNRTSLGRENQLIRDFRPRFHDAVARALGVA